MKSMTIEIADNGYIVETHNGVCRIKEVYTELVDVMSRMLLSFEGLSSSFKDDCYGCVTITRGRDVKE